MRREQIMNDIETFQAAADAMNFKGENEHDLFLRESIADYIEKKISDAFDDGFDITSESFNSSILSYGGARNFKEDEEYQEAKKETIYEHQN